MAKRAVVLQRRVSSHLGYISKVISQSRTRGKVKGSIGHAFAVCIPTENQNQCSFYPFVLREISVLTELHLGRLRYGLTGIPPQTNSPPNHVSRKNQTINVLNFRTGLHQSFLHEISKMTTWVVVLQARFLSHLGYTPRAISQS